MTHNIFSLSISLSLSLSLSLYTHNSPLVSAATARYFLYTTHCNTLLQHTATHCNTSQKYFCYGEVLSLYNTLQHTAPTHCNTIQVITETPFTAMYFLHTAHRNTLLQHSATHCNKSQQYFFPPAIFIFEIR